MSTESRTCEHVEALRDTTDAEREAFLRWWEGQANWTGSPCAVAYQGWLARAGRATSLDGLRIREWHCAAPDAIVVRFQREVTTEELGVFPKALLDALRQQSLQGHSK